MPAGSVRCLWTAYAYKWPMGVDSSSWCVTISKVSACSGKWSNQMRYHADCFLIMHIYKKILLAVFVGARLHVTGGALKGGRNIEGEGAIAVDFFADMLLGDFLVAENSPLQSEISSSMYNPERVPAVNHSVNSDSQSVEQELDKKSGMTSSASLRKVLKADMGLYFIVSVDRKSIDMLTEASAAEAEAASAVWRAAKEASIESLSDDKESESQVNDEFSNAENSSDAAYSLEPDVRLHSRAVVVAKETVGSLGGLIRQLSLDQFENESRRVHPTNGEQTYSAKKFLNRQKSPQGLHKKASM
ncbi:hypothetical protein B296_00035434 [Ensete ventricosum]|uniref:Uncharacterized protein n=1 Tax=Ensete ventricosum TaxID=4639 RepID=A0A426ZS61_ENSVE|nr:hypothetical protein B296_00035434 [Ensete ventricosum]